MEHIRQHDWCSTKPDHHFVRVQDINNCVVERILRNKFHDPLVSSDSGSDDDAPRVHIDWDEVFKRKNNDFHRRLYVPGLHKVPPQPRLSTLTAQQHYHIVRILASQNPDILPSHYGYGKVNRADHKVFEEVKETYEKERKEYIEWAKTVWTNDHCVRAIRPKPIIEMVYEAEFKVRAHEMASFPKVFELAAQIPLDTSQEKCEIIFQKALTKVRTSKLQRINPPDMSKRSTLLNPCSVPEPCTKHPVRFILPNEKSMSILPLTEVHRELAQFGAENGVCMVASEAALCCFVETHRPWTLPISVFEVLGIDGESKRVIVFDGEFSVSRQSAQTRAYRAFRHLLSAAFVQSAERERFMNEEDLIAQGEKKKHDKKSKPRASFGGADNGDLDDISSEEEEHLVIADSILETQTNGNEVRQPESEIKKEEPVKVVPSNDILDDDSDDENNALVIDFKPHEEQKCTSHVLDKSEQSKESNIKEECETAEAESSRDPYSGNENNEGSCKMNGSDSNDAMNLSDTNVSVNGVDGKHNGTSKSADYVYDSDDSHNLKLVLEPNSPKFEDEISQSDDDIPLSVEKQKLALNKSKSKNNNKNTKIIDKKEKETESGVDKDEYTSAPIGKKRKAHVLKTSVVKKGKLDKHKTDVKVRKSLEKKEFGEENRTNNTNKVKSKHKIDEELTKDIENNINNEESIKNYTNENKNLNIIENAENICDDYSNCSNNENTNNNTNGNNGVENQRKSINERRNSFYHCTCEDVFKRPPPRSFKKFQVRNNSSREKIDVIVHCSHKYTLSGEQEVLLEPVPEYQLELGASQQPTERLASLALRLALRGNHTQVFNVRIDGPMGEVVRIDKLQKELQKPELVHRATSTVHSALSQLQGLMPGHYILQHESNHGSNALLYAVRPPSTSATHKLELHFDCTSSLDTDEAKTLVTPVLSDLLLPMHKFRRLAPCAFSPFADHVAKEPKKPVAKQKPPPQAIKKPHMSMRPHFTGTTKY